MTCLETEEKFGKLNVKPRTRRSSANEDKKDEMVCETCNLHFSSKNIFDLHMKLMHFKKEAMYEEVVNDINIRVAKNNKPLLEMVFLQTDLKKRRKDSSEERGRDSESKRRRLVLDKPNKSDKDKKIRLATSRASRRNHREETSKDIVNLPELKPNIEEIQETLTERSSRLLTRNKIAAAVAVTKEDVKMTNRTRNNTIKKSHCKFCGKNFASIDSLMIHVRVLHPSKCQSCPLCNRFYMNMKSHKKQYGCDLFNFRKQNLMLSDISSAKVQDSGRTIYYMRSEKNLPICLICRRICLSMKCLEMHLTTSHKAGARCIVCRKIYPSISYCTHMARGCSKLLSRESFNYTSDGECICPICNNVFKDKSILKRHLVNHLYQNLQCPKCNEKFVQIVTYCQHVVKGCGKKVKGKKGWKGKNANTTTFIKCDDMESNAENTMLPQDDPLKEDETHLPLKSMQKPPSLINELQGKNVKVEPTELLDQTGFLSAEDSLSSDTAKYMNTTSVNDEVAVDQPEFVYVVQNVGDESAK